MNRLLQAMKFAAEKHAQQRRKNADATPYINHPIEVAEHLSTVGGVSDEDMLIAALLHDTIEDTKTTFEEIESRFGLRVAKIVMECTDDKSLEKAERKRLQIINAPHKSSDAKCVKIADKTCNLASILTDPPRGWSIRRQQEYFDWAEQVIQGLLGVNEKLDTNVKNVLAQGKSVLQRTASPLGCTKMKSAECVSIASFIAAIRALPSDKPKVSHGKWYATQKEHWLGWLSEYHGPGAYGRTGSAAFRDARFAYNHIVEVKMLLWLIEAAGVSRSLVQKARVGAARGRSLSRKSAIVRKHVPWERLHESLFGRNAAQLAVPSDGPALRRAPRS